MEIQQKVILLIEESEPLLFSSQEKMVAYLISNSDTDMNKTSVKRFIQERTASTPHANYTWDWLTIDDKLHSK